MKQEKEKKELTEEEKIAKTKRNFKIVGGCCISVGGLVMIFSIINFFAGMQGVKGNATTMVSQLIAGGCAVFIGIILELKARK